ncbi:MAG: hypothetical protein ABI365_05840 [Lysobacteraceae bacterium]
MGNDPARSSRQRLRPAALLIVLAVGIALIVGVLLLGPVSQRFDCSRNDGERSCAMVDRYVFSAKNVAQFPEANIAAVEVEDSHSHGARNAAPFSSVMLVLGDGTRYPVASYPLHSDASDAASRLRGYLADPHAQAFAFGGHPLIEMLALFVAIPVLLVGLLFGLARFIKKRRSMN